MQWVCVGLLRISSFSHLHHWFLIQQPHVLSRKSHRDPAGTSQWNSAGFEGPGLVTRHSATVLLMPWRFPPAWKPRALLAIMRPNYIRQSWNFYASKEVHQRQPFPSRQFLKQRCMCRSIFQISNNLFQGLTEKQEEWKCLFSCNIAGTLLPTHVPKCFYKWTFRSSFNQPLPLHRVSSGLFNMQSWKLQCKIKKRKGTGLGKAGEQREELGQKILESWTHIPAINKMKGKM